ncbi:MAG TPA: hypothetical protein VM580_32505 [Labilithrix sp.]|nr:hypothetical protein [Labilithrix sp.]
MSIESDSKPSTWRDGPIGRKNVVWGWCGIVLGPSVGSIMMAWCFSGPFQAPMAQLAEYDSLERRMLRLAHVALVMLPLINIAFGKEIDQVRLSEKWKRHASFLCLQSIIGVPLGLTLGGLFWVPLKYLSGPSVYGFIVALALIAVGKVRQAREEERAEAAGGSRRDWPGTPKFGSSSSDAEQPAE